jgi:DNA-binding transcriptional LysR family regulator
LTGRLRFCAAVTFARLRVMPHLPTFLEQHPALDVDVVLDDRTVDLVEEGIDVALRMGSLRDSALTARKIGHGRRLVLGTPSYFAKHGEPGSPIDLVILYQRPYRLTVCAQERWVMEAICSGICMSLFQASQQASTMAS